MQTHLYRLGDVKRTKDRAKRDIRKEINRDKIMRGVRRFALLVLYVFPLLLFLYRSKT